MRLMKKAYCRTFQGAMRLALPVLPYREPERLSAIGQVPETLRKEGIDSVLLITDSSIRKCGLTAQLERILAENRIHCAVYDQTVANPTSENVESAKALYEQDHCGALIGFGGGSSIDCAKGVGARIARPHTPLSKMGGILRVHHKLPPVFAIPTTAGTGSEVTLAAVITDSQTRHKYAINDFFLIPRYAVHDPELTRSLPAGLTAATGMDALTHAVEAYIGRSTTKETRADALEAVRLISQYLETAVQDGNNMTARRNMLDAAYLAGNAFSQSYVGYVHAVAHSLSGKYNLPHGFTNAVLLPHVLELYGHAIDGKLADLARAAGIQEETPAAAAQAFIRKIRDMNRKFRIPTFFQELRREDIKELARTADREANPLYPVPVLMDGEQLEHIYELVLSCNQLPAMEMQENQVQKAVAV